MKWNAIVLVLNGILSVATANTDDGRIIKHITEDQEKGYIVANMARVFGVTYSERLGRTFKSLTQKLVTRNPPSTTQNVDLLSLDTNTGVITTSRKLDREELCRKAKECVIQIQAVMLPNQFFTMLSMDVVVEDVNDNPPRFSQKNIAITVTEGEVAKGDVISLDQYRAVDNDIGANGDLSYELQKNSYFSVKSYQDDNGASHLELITLAEPDHEKTSLLELTLTATDGGQNPLTDSAILTINISDANDHDPVFEQQEYFVRLKENDDRPHIVATVHAGDDDSGDFGAVRYFIPGPAIDDSVGIMASELLSINALTGEVTLKRKVDRETHDGLRVPIEARDSDSVKPRVGKTTLVIQVEDVNDNAPIINVNFIVDSVNLTGYIPESASIKTYVAYVTASDNDNGENGKVSSYIAAFGKYKARKELIELKQQFTLFPDGLLATGRSLDRENFQYFVVQISSCDHGLPVKCSAQNITVVVLDTNDNSPAFDSCAKAVLISEDSKVGSFITGVHAEDKDARYTPSLWKNKEGKIEESRNGVIRYSIIQGNTDYFSIDKVSGDLLLKKPLDYETRTEWKLTIEARDGGWQTSSSVNCSILIRVRDVNDNRPIFIRPAGNNEKVYATISREQIIMTVKALDSDNGSNSKILYKIFEQDGRPIKHNQTSSAFILNPSTGKLRLNFSKPNVTEFLGRHTIVVQASDSGSPPLSAAVLIHVTVINGELPDPVNLAGFDEKSILFAITLSGGVCLIIVAIAGIIVCRRRNSREARSSNCKVADKKDEGWIDSPGIGNEAHDGTLRCSRSNVLDATTSGIYKDDYSTSQLSAKDDGVLTQENQKSYAINQKEMTTFKAKSQTAPTAVVLSSVRVVDRDSGRGDSDSETGNLPNIDETAAQIHPSHAFSENQDNNLRKSELGPRCDKTCLTQGHSDTCWMPSPDSDNYRSRWPQTTGFNYGLTASAPRLDAAGEYNSGNPADRSNEYPTIRHLSSTGHYSTVSDYYNIMSLSPRRQSDPYYLEREGNLAPIAEMNDTERYADPTYEEDDVSTQTQRRLFTTTPKSLLRGSADWGLYAEPIATCLPPRENSAYATRTRNHQSCDSQFTNSSQGQNTPSPGNYVEFTRDCRRPLASPIPRGSHPGTSFSSSSQSSRLSSQSAQRLEGENLFETSPHYAGREYYHANDFLQNARVFQI